MKVKKTAKDIYLQTKNFIGIDKIKDLFKK